MTSDSKFGYIYITENLINGMRYVGRHASCVFDKNYLGSGVRITNAVNKYGKSNFKVEPIEWCSSNEELNEREKYWIAYYNAAYSDDFYNITEGGDGFVIRGKNHHHYGKKDSKETCEKRSKSLKGHIVTEETRQKLREANTGKRMSVEVRRKISEKSSGRKHTEEELIKMRASSHKGKDNPACRPEVREYMNADKRKRVMCIELGVVYKSLAEAATKLNLEGTGNIGKSAREYAKGHSIKGNGYHWKYV